MSDTVKGSWSRVQDHQSYRETMARLYPDKRPAPVEPPAPEPEEPTEPENIKAPCSTHTTPT